MGKEYSMTSGFNTFLLLYVKTQFSTIRTMKQSEKKKEKKVSLSLRRTSTVEKMAIIDKLKSLGGTEKSLDAASPAAPPGAPPTIKSIYQNRFNFGVNFGSLFLQEKFIFHRFFINDTNTEFDAISAYLDKNGEEQTRADLEDHWNSFVTDDDWNWLKSKGVTSVRIPIGYWHVDGGKFTSDSCFKRLAPVYKNAWTILKNIIAKAKEYDIGVLVDLHALPGGANTAEHSGLQLKRAEFWDDSKCNKTALSILEFVAQDLKDVENVIGLQIVNEAEFDNDASKQKQYYSKAIKQIRQVDQGVPVIISDGWWPDQWVKWVNEKESKLDGQSIGVVIDTHIYRCFSDQDKNKSPEQIINDLGGDLLTNLSGSADIIVGEYSHVLDGSSWDKAQHDRSELVRNYGNTLNRLISTRADAGFFFWTFKFQEGDGGEWGFVPQVEQGNLPAKPTRINREPTSEDFQRTTEDELNAHSNHWDNENSNEQYEHWRYKEGFITGWADSVEFGKFNASVIGRLNAWKSARRVEHINHRGNSKFLWEWEQGFDKGIQKAKEFMFS